MVGLDILLMGGDLDLSLMKGVAFGWSGHTTNEGGLRLKLDERGGHWLVWTYY